MCILSPQLLHLGLFTVMQLHRKLIWYVHFLTSCSHVCEWGVSWESSWKCIFWVLENPGIWPLQILESPGKQCFNVCMNPGNSSGNIDNTGQQQVAVTSDLMSVVCQLSFHQSESIVIRCCRLGSAGCVLRIAACRQLKCSTSEEKIV